MTNILDETACPFCKGVNKCMAKTDTACWCKDVKIPNELLDLVPDSLKRKSCICQSCIALFNDNPSLFTSKKPFE